MRIPSLLLVGFLLLGAGCPESTVPVAVPTDTSSAVSENSNVAPVEAVVSNTAPADAFLVVKVVDGDTFDVDINGTETRVRIIGMNTPETVDPRKPVECFGRDASARAKELLVGQRVRLESDDSQDDRDKYDRILRHVFLADGKNFALTMIQDGYAYEYTYDAAYRGQAEYKEAQATAQREGRGLWKKDGCNGKALFPASVSFTEPPAAAATAPAPAPAPKSVPTPTPEPVTTPVASCVIKGNISSEKIYHLPGCASYNQTIIDESKGERWFCTETEAVQAGWRKAKNC